jgi:serine phosphatase RsbU (regulator of sigma subunit)
VPWLVALDGDLRGRRFSVNAPCLIGRGQHNHVVLDDGRASRQHARISPEADQFVVYDLKSANGTYVNDQRVDRHVLRPNDKVKVGHATFRFEVEAERPLPPLVAGGFREAKTGVGDSAVFAAVEAEDMEPLGGFAAGGLAELEDAERKLKALYRFLYTIGGAADASELFERVVQNIFETFKAAKLVGVYLRNSDNKMSLRMARVRDEKTARSTAREEFPATPTKPKVVSGGLKMQAPMVYRGVVEGVLVVRGGTDGRFTHEDLGLLNGLATYAALGLGNIRMQQRAFRQQRFERDLALAERIQKSFLPRQFPVIEGLEFAAEYHPAYTIGGDFYDVFLLGENKVGMLIGDVAGKGIAAALLMARVLSDLRMAALSRPDPARVLSTVNEVVIERQQHDIFVTVTYLTLDMKSQELVVASAGHGPLLVRRKGGQVERLEPAVGPPIGVFEGTRYDPMRFSMNPGDMMLMYTDGVLEAQNRDSVQFGIERVAGALRGGGYRASSVIARLLAELAAFGGPDAEFDDLTILACAMPDEEGSFDDSRDDRTPVTTP